jgi:hypothetical protein
LLDNWRLWRVRGVSVYMYLVEYDIWRGSQDISVGTTTRYRLDSLGIVSQWGARFSTPVQTTHLHLVFRLTKERSYNSTPPLGLCGLLQGKLYLYFTFTIYRVVMSCNAGKNIYKMRRKRSILPLTLCYLLWNTAKMSSQTKQTKLGKHPRIGHACYHSFPVISLLEAMQAMMLKNN